MKPCCILGNYTTSEQIKVLKDFKEKKFNVLCATTVVEEGLDISACKLVVNFDSPDTTKSFIQRRGRARARGGLFIFLVPESKSSKDLLHLKSIQNQETEMNCLSQSLDSVDTDLLGKLIGTEQDVKVDHQVVIANKQDIIADNQEQKYATQLLYQYCQQLQPLELFKPQPIFITEKVSESPKLYSTSVLLPSAVPPSIRCCKGIYLLLELSSNN